MVAKHQLLDPVILRLGDEESVVWLAYNAVNVVELAGLLASLAVPSEKLSVEVDLHDPVRLSVGDKHLLTWTAGYTHGPGVSDVVPLPQVIAVRIENLHARVLAVADVDQSLRVGGDGVRQVEIAGC